MQTPSQAFPFSPAQSDHGFQPAGHIEADDERPNELEDKRARDSTRPAPTHTRYPSPPPQPVPASGYNASRSHSSKQSARPAYDASLVIPPFNPHGRAAAGARTPADASTAAQERLAAFAAHQNALTHQQQQYVHQYPALNQRPMSVAVGMPSVPPSTTRASQHYTQAHSQQQQQQHTQEQQHAASASTSRVRQSVGYLPSQQSVSSAGPYPQFYTPHPIPRQKIYFGPYILLQTLGEGEFGKVKLGIHSERWGEDVAIKLIKRGNVDTAQRGEKVRREIEVLKAVRHPNIVRLYDVIETEKYIGIVLEYASGGELFDHILAHRYLKERDAARMFAQLISGVAYLHAKGVVHRDLKLENLLLDRNRNCIITDFGFANRFRDPTVDLMATSCGSPCYAAPELVVQEGKYIGTAVDVWSCGVILYAMLAGYLPYDDDPNNPEGDNINLLYKYIINTALTFPDWITQEPRELLLMMLVPDPAKRCTIQDVMNHSWLKRFRPAFEKSVEELERQAQEMEIFKRQALEAQKQWLIAQHQRSQQGQMSPQVHTGMVRSMTTMGPVASATPAGPATRSRKDGIVPSQSAAAGLAIDAQPTVSEEVSHQQSQPAQNSTRPMTIQPLPQDRTRRSSGFAPTSPTTTQTHRISVDADPFSFEPRATSPPASVPMQPSLSAPPDAPPVAQSEGGSIFGTAPSTPIMDSPATGTRSRRSSGKPVQAMSTVTDLGREATLALEQAELERRKKANRATVQVEYDGGSASRQPVTRSEIPKTEDVVMASVESEDIPVESGAPSETSTDAMAVPVQQNLTQRPTTPPLIPLPTTMPGPASNVAIDESSVSTPKKRKSSSSPRSGHSTLPSQISAAQEARPATTQQSHAPDTQSTPRAKKTSDASSGPRPPSVASSSVSRHRHGMSADRFSLKSLLSGSSSSLANNGKKEESELSALEEVTNKRKSRRQKAMSLQPFKSSNASAATSTKTKRSDLPPPAPSSRAKSRVSIIEAEGSMAPPPARQQSHRPNTRASVHVGMAPPARRPTSTDLEANWSSSSPAATTSAPAAPAPAGKAKSVMDWFRRRSTRAYAAATGSDTSSLAGPAPSFDRRDSASTARTNTDAPTSSNVSMADGTSTPLASAPLTPALERAPSVVVTSSATLPPVEEAFAPSRSASGAQSQLSHFSHKTTSTTATSVSSMSSAAAVTAPSGVSASRNNSVVSTRASTAAAAGSGSGSIKLRTHLGALDKNALTYRNPTMVMMELKNALWNMGVDMVQEGEFKIKCVRKSRKKAAALAAASTVTGSLGSNSSSGGGQASSPTTIVNSGAPADRRNSLLSSSTSVLPASTSFRNLFTRKNSNGLTSSPSLGAGPLSPALSESAFESSPLTPAVSQFGQFGSSASTISNNQPQPVYGDLSTDHGDEVKFVVELCSVKHLQQLVIVDVKRTKGNAWSFKTVYSQLIGSLDLGDV
ncbi:hypothetical protein OIV83_004689 [Microbotryomycetes sp. JL201]|nr:hypothetical protein OIV83_004689 [Microbotryomycetes sp. JL201]